MTAFDRDPPNLTSSQNDTRVRTAKKQLWPVLGQCGQRAGVERTAGVGQSADLGDSTASEADFLSPNRQLATLTCRSNHRKADVQRSRSRAEFVGSIVF